MNLKPLAANMTEVKAGSLLVLFSYETPVAYFDSKSGQYYKTNKFWSRTTSRHISKWIGSGNELKLNNAINEIDQSILDNLLNEVN